MALNLAEGMGVAAFVMALIAAGLVAAVLGLILQNPCTGCHGPHGGGGGSHYHHVPHLPAISRVTLPGGGPTLAGADLPAPAPAPAAAGGAQTPKPPAAPAGGVERLTREQVEGLKHSPIPMAVWAVTSTCGPCRSLMSTLDAMWNKGSLVDLPVAGVVLRDQWPADMKPAYTPTLYKVGSGVYAEAGTGAGTEEAIKQKLRALNSK